MGSIADGKVLVTGGGGFLGGAIVRRLADRGVSVRSFSRSAYPQLADLGVEQVQGDIADLRAVKDACEGVELVFHTAALPGVWGDYERFYRTNTLGASRLIQACRETGVARLVHTSSPSVVFDGTDMEGVDESVPYPPRYHAHYPRTKALAEQAVKEAARTGLPAVILRPHLIWGPGDRHLAPRILERAESLRIVGPGNNLVDTIYIDNAADAHLSAAEALKSNPDLSGRIYFISQDNPINLWEMVNHILAAGDPKNFPPYGPHHRVRPRIFLPIFSSQRRTPHDPLRRGRTRHRPLVRHQRRKTGFGVSADGIHRAGIALAKSVASKEALLIPSPLRKMKHISIYSLEKIFCSADLVLFLLPKYENMLLWKIIPYK